MSSYSRAGQLAAYQSVAAHGGVAAADPHRLVLMLMDGALERIAAARGCIQSKATIEKARVVHRAVAIIDELRCSLDLDKGGPIAANLDDLYDYCCRQLLRGSVQNRVEFLDEVATLLKEIRSAWIALPSAGRELSAAAAR
ncbi:MAG: flagellar export chaperone FliS [Gammaproteobacteria bacterium]|nr:flagellar export chaperone FliS [Gammaproteobacteria bacterium]